MTVRSRYVVLIAAAQLAACNESPAPPAPAPQAPAPAAAQADEKLVLAFGDSLYAGYRVDPSQSLPSVIERELEARGIPARVVNAGVSGDTTAGGARRLAFTLDGLERAPDLAIVGLGGNDLLRGIDPAETRRNLEAILAELDKRGVPLIVTGMRAPPNYGGDYVASFEAIYPELAAKYDARLDPFILDKVITDPALLLPDRIHPNPRGIELMARRIVPLAADALKPAG